MEQSTDKFNILKTKFCPPNLTSDLVPRDRLMELLEGSQEVPLTLVSAPAGYGKSVMVCQWLEQYDGPVFWFSIDEDDSNLHQFMAYLVTNLQSQFPDQFQPVWNLLQSKEKYSAAAMAGSLSNCLDDLNRPCTIVLDDYHSLRNDSAVHRWLEAFLKHPPVVRDRSSQRSSRRISKQGNARIRRALFMPALVAIQRDANVSAYYEKRLKSGIAKLQAITAVMRKLLHALWGMLHLRQEWNGEKFYRLSEPKTT